MRSISNFNMTKMVELSEKSSNFKFHWRSKLWTKNRCSTEKLYVRDYGLVAFIK